MNNIDKQYQVLLQDILDNGVKKEDRTGTGTISVFGRQIRHKMSEGFPLLTTKKMPFKTIVTELLWFLRGDTNIKYLVDNNCHIWDGDCFSHYGKKMVEIMNIVIPSEFMDKGWVKLNSQGQWVILSKEEFIYKIKTDDEFANKWGDLGPIYGKQWRNWSRPTIQLEKLIPQHFDQIQNLINDLKTNPDSRRLMVNAWNVGELDQMVLPPCHYGFQVYTRELSFDEFWDRLTLKQRGSMEKPYEGETYNDIDSRTETKSIISEIHKIPTRAISLMWNQRSCDFPLGIPFNIASYGLLLEIIAKEVNMVPDELIGNFGDCHIYLNQIEGCKEQIGRKYTHEERTELLKQEMGEEKYNKSVDELIPFSPVLIEYYDSYKIPYITREPFPLPTLKIESEVKWGEGDVLPYYSVNDIVVENYQSHPTIKYPLSN